MVSKGPMAQFYSRTTTALAYVLIAVHEGM